MAHKTRKIIKLFHDFVSYFNQIPIINLRKIKFPPEQYNEVIQVMFNYR